MFRVNETIWLGSDCFGKGAIPRAGRAPLRQINRSFSFESTPTIFHLRGLSGNNTSSAPPLARSPEFPMEGGDRTLVNGVAISFVQPRRLQVQSSGGDEAENEAGNVSDDPIRVLHLEIETLRRRYSDMQRALASNTADLQQAHIQRSSESENSPADFDTQVLDDLKNDLKVHVRLIERRMENLLTEKESEAADLLKKDVELRFIVEKLNFEAEKTRVALEEKKDAVTLIFKDLKKLLKKFKKWEAKIVIAGEKESIISSEERLQLLGVEYFKLRSIHKRIVKLTLEMRKQWIEIDELLCDYKESMKHILSEVKDDRNRILQYIVEFSWLIALIVVVTTIVVVVAMQFLQFTVGRIAKD